MKKIDSSNVVRPETKLAKENVARTEKHHHLEDSLSTSQADKIGQPELRTSQEWPSQFMNKPGEIRSALDSKTIAVVGASKDPTKDSHTVAAYLKSHGYKIIPVNPTTDRILDEPSYKSLLDIPEEKARMIDLIDIFRPSQDVPPIVADAVQLKKKYGHLKSIWMQLGISNSKAAEEARQEGIQVIQDACIRIEHGRTSKKG